MHKLSSNFCGPLRFPLYIKYLRSVKYSSKKATLVSFRIVLWSNMAFNLVYKAISLDIIIMIIPSLCIHFGNILNCLIY